MSTTFLLSILIGGHLTNAYAFPHDRRMDPQKAISSLLKRGWTQQQVADEIGVNQSTIQRIYLNGQKPGWDLALKIMKLAQRK